MLPRRRLIILSPRYLIDVAVQMIFPRYPQPHLWMLLRTDDPHPVLLSQHVSTQMGSRSASSFSVDMFVQTPIRSVVLHDVATQQLITKFYIDCIFSNDPLDSPNFVRQPPS